MKGTVVNRAMPSLHGESFEITPESLLMKIIYTPARQSIFKTDLLHEDDKNLPEDLDEVDEEVQGVSNEVLVSTTSLIF